MYFLRYGAFAEKDYVFLTDQEAEGVMNRWSDGKFVHLKRAKVMLNERNCISLGEPPEHHGLTIGWCPNTAGICKTRLPAWLGITPAVVVDGVEVAPKIAYLREADRGDNSGRHYWVRWNPKKSYVVSDLGYDMTTEDVDNLIAQAGFIPYDDVVTKPEHSRIPLSHLLPEGYFNRED
jgi:hypothetical protein